MKKLAFAALLGLVSAFFAGVCQAQTQQQVTDQAAGSEPVRVAAIPSSPPQSLYFSSGKLAGHWENSAIGRNDPSRQTILITIDSDDGKGKATGKFTAYSSGNSMNRCATVVDLPVDITYNLMTGSGEIHNQKGTSCERHWTFQKKGVTEFEGESQMGSGTRFFVKAAT